MTRCRCGKLAHRSHWGRVPINPKAWRLLLRHRDVYDCYCGRAWAEKED